MPDLPFSPDGFVDMDRLDAIDPDAVTPITELGLADEVPDLAADTWTELLDDVFSGDVDSDVDALISPNEEDPFDASDEASDDFDADDNPFEFESVWSTRSSDSDDDGVDVEDRDEDLDTDGGEGDDIGASAGDLVDLDLDDDGGTGAGVGELVDLDLDTSDSVDEDFTVDLDLDTSDSVDEDFTVELDFDTDTDDGGSIVQVELDEIDEIDFD